jgi:RHS repeat-associated protein
MGGVAMAQMHSEKQLIQAGRRPAIRAGIWFLLAVFVATFAVSTAAAQGYSYRAANNGVLFIVAPTPTISSLAPSSGVAGASVTITGSGFGSSAGTLTFNGQPLATSSWSDTAISFVVPSGAVTGLVVVNANGMQSNGAIFVVDVPAPIYSPKVLVQIAPSAAGTPQIVSPSLSVQPAQQLSVPSVPVSAGIAPGINGLSANAAPIGTAVTINGLNFGSSQGPTGQVSLNGAMVTPTSWSSATITVAVPATTTTTGNVQVTINGMMSNSVLFTVIPGITSLSVSSADPGTPVTIRGTSFGAAQGGGSVTINGVSAPVSSWNDGSITAVVPVGGGSGNLVVTNSSGLSSSGVPFTVADNFAITALSPPLGQVGTLVTITGGGFGSPPAAGVASTNAVSFGGAFAVINSWSDNQITAVVPAGALTGPVTVINVAGSTATSPMNFVVDDIVQIIDSLGNTTSYTAEVFGGAWLTVGVQGSGCSSCSMRGNITNSFDNNGNLITHTDELGHVTSYTYDGSGNMTSESIPLNTTTTVTTSYTYNSFNEVLTMTDPMGNVTTNAYDANGNLLSVTTPAPNGATAASVTQFAYNSLGDLTQITDPLGNVTTLTYTPAGFISTITDAQKNVTSYQYDAHGNRTATTDALGNTTSFAYDAGDRLVTITYPDKTTASFGYDSRGRRTSVTDQNGHTTSYTYDDGDRLTSVTDAGGNVTQYSYDTENNLLNITDAAGNVTSFGYDAFGRVSQTSFPSGLAETYTYDAAGNLASKKDRKGQSILYVYDALNRLTFKQYPDSTAVDYVYDLAGKIKQVTDPTGSYGFAYDNIGRLIGTTTQYSFLPGLSFSNSYGYDANSNRTSFTGPGLCGTAAPGCDSVSYQYDSLSRLSTLTSSLTGQFTFSYDALSRRTSLGRPNGVSTNYTYDPLSRVLSVLHQAGANTLDGDSYTYDQAGNRVSKTNQLNNVTEQYAYDAIYQLIQVTATPQNQGTTTTESYTYDAVGNRLTALTVPQFTYNSSNELTSTSAASYNYDNNGNMLSKTISGNTTQYAWDFENRLSSAVMPGTGGTVRFQYDPFGRRIQKAFTQGTTTTVTIYLYDGHNSVAEVDQNGNVLTRYTQGPAIDEPLAELRSGTTNFYEADGLGSITALTGPKGTVSASYAYDAFGNLTDSSGSIVNPFQYTGRDYDPETGIRYYRARYYDSNIGRFISEDPIGSLNVRPNFYLYGKNEPTIFNDPSGLKETPQQIFQDAENEALRRLKNPDCAVHFNNKGPCTIRATRYRRKPANFYPGQWVAETPIETLVYINQDGLFYNFVPGQAIQYIDPLTQPNTAYNVPVGTINNAMALLHELQHQLGIGVSDGNDPVAQLANNLAVLRSCFSDLRITLP